MQHFESLPNQFEYKLLFDSHDTRIYLIQLFLLIKNMITLENWMSLQVALTLRETLDTFSVE